MENLQTLTVVSSVAFLGITIAVLFVAYALQWMYHSDRRKVSGADEGGGAGGGAGGSMSKVGNGGGLSRKSWQRLNFRSSRRLNLRDMDTKFLETYA